MRYKKLTQISIINSLSSPLWGLHLYKADNTLPPRTALGHQENKNKNKRLEYPNYFMK